jgi:hypothetical protein
MNATCCPICKSNSHQSFWFWEKEDKLMRLWAMDTRTNFSICRECALIFQNPLVHSPSSEDSMFGSWDSQSDAMISPKEPLEWLRQFPRRGRNPERALEVYSKNSRFKDTLQNENWDVQAISLSDLLSETGNASGATVLADGDEYDLIFCFDVLEKTDRPLEVLSKLHKHLKSTGGLLVETFNPYVAPRLNKICLTSDDACVLPFQTLIYALYKAGFTNQAAEVCGKSRCYCTKIDPNPDAEATKLITPNYWAHLTHRFQRNYYWAWVCGFLDRFLKQTQSNPDFLQHTRTLLRQRPEDLSEIRDVCGAALLFVQEIDAVRQTISKDWSLTMQRLFDILSKDYVLFDLLQTGAAIPNFGTLPDIERYYFNDKMIFMTNTDYFERFFTQDDAAQLCQGIIKSGEIVCKNLSSFL